VPDSLITGYLEIVRAATGAEEVVFWRGNPEFEELAPEWWSTAHGGEPEHFVEQTWRGLVQWAVEEGRPQTVGAEVIQLVAAPVSGGEGGVVGALSISSQSGLRGGRDALKTSIVRYCAHVGSLYELIRARGQYHRATQQSSALLTAAQRFSVNRSIEALGDSITTAALEMTAGYGAALVHWNHENETGEVAYSSPDARAREGLKLDFGGHVARACSADIPLVMEDARRLNGKVVLFGDGEKPGGLGSLAILPLRGDGGVIGAIVIEGRAPGDVRQEDAKNLRLLALLAASSLQTVWEIEEITRRARMDPLTELYNRGHFEDRLRQMLAETARFGGESSLVMFDIDHFKEVNDTHGHPAGDAVLKAIARLLEARVRNVDTCARYGGEELALLLPRTDLDGAVELANRLRLAVIDNPVPWGGGYLTVTVSGGAASFPHCARSPEALIVAADAALYRAKQGGRDRVEAAALLPFPATG
jgi:diguanylate cyclase (GGDEF)-like protein